MRGGGWAAGAMALLALAAGPVSATSGQNFEAYLRTSQLIQVPAPVDFGVRLGGALMMQLSNLDAAGQAPTVQLGPSELRFVRNDFKTIQAAGQHVQYSTTPLLVQEVWNVSVDHATIQLLDANPRNQIHAALVSPSRASIHEGTDCSFGPMRIARFEDPAAAASDLLATLDSIERTGSNMDRLRVGARLQVVCESRALDVERIERLQFAGFRIGLRYQEVGAPGTTYRVLETQFDMAPNATVPNTTDHTQLVLQAGPREDAKSLEATLSLHGPRTQARLWTHMLTAAGHLRIPPSHGEATWGERRFEGSVRGLEPEGAFVATPKGLETMQLTGLTVNAAPPSLSPPPSSVAAVVYATLLALALGGLGSVAWKLRFVVVGLFTRLTKDHALDHPRRRAVLEAVTHNPGARTKDLSDLLQMSRRVVDHHVNVLVRQGLLVRRNTGRFTAFFAKPPQDPRMADRIALGRSASARRLVDRLRREPTATQRQLAARTGLSQPYVSQLLRRLCEAGVIQRSIEDGAGYEVIDASGWKDETPPALN